jgi:hypothetical protein
LPQQSGQRKPQKLAGRPFCPLEPGESLHHLKNLIINLDRIHRSPATEPVAPTSGISGTPLPEVLSTMPKSGWH